MTSAPIRDPLADHLLAPQNAALLFIGYQPAPLPGSARWTALLVKKAVSTVKIIRTLRVPVVRSTVKVAAGRDSQPSPASPAA
jgi:hypothetical protein